MDITGTTALVTGANRGLGRHFASQLLERGARRVYAAARDPSTIDLPGVVAVALDVTDPASVAAAAALAGDTTLLVNNAGISQPQPLLSGDLEVMRREMETNHFGILATLRAFAPILAANGGGGVLNVLSAMSWGASPGVSGYGASKAAAWSLTNHARLELAAQGTQVTGLYLALTDTDMTAGFDAPKNDPADVVRAALDGLAAGAAEVVADEDTARVKAELSRDPAEAIAL
ncbi:SDR family oxidoreductase [Patulibacter sp.]|uniref:SDR family oxidoreductase n=1 Tax=Patulibacter sp. TaxID=1912859 RepID=UPI002719346B|nr:SDR family oxidoreductase [Patulibacter sp.]MDO9410824.1 SDR family oxidoreductase [Patulibacter sp.]